MNYQIKQAGIGDHQQIAVLFDQYRQFYQQTSNIKLAEAYLKERLELNQSIIFHAVDHSGCSLGFTQLYPSFCSVALKPVFILYDLYVLTSARTFGVGRALMNAATEHAKAHDATYISLETETNNTNAQALYESLGYAQDDEYLKYFLELDNK
ncbi:GNAT family N-acetyltransferase [Thalassotalea fonticola]|uniref:GNAT family N-acetyltransferase n=1 Tax=Thalassotalea fonticola TaxID=3065649 RepID=A0ABZ0GLT5_9GAMM|nr:GNAT family N-acetyltransferase [Colwelliaceae bacterium S1-1]